MDYGQDPELAHHPYYNAFSGRDMDKFSYHHHTTDAHWSLRVRGPGLDRELGVVDLVETMIETSWEECKQ